MAMIFAVNVLRRPALVPIALKSGTASSTRFAACTMMSPISRICGSKLLTSNRSMIFAVLFI